MLFYVTSPSALSAVLEAISDLGKKFDAYHSVTRHASGINVADFDRLLEELRIVIQEVDDQGIPFDVIDFENQERTPKETARAVGAKGARPDSIESLKWLHRQENRERFW